MRALMGRGSSASAMRRRRGRRTVMWPRRGAKERAVAMVADGVAVDAARRAAIGAPSELNVAGRTAAERSTQLGAIKGLVQGHRVKETKEWSEDMRGGRELQDTCGCIVVTAA